jgi:hypothetical protein
VTIIVKCPDTKEDFSENHIVDLTDKSPIDMWEHFSRHPHKTRTLTPWVGPRFGEWSFFYELTGDGRYLVIDFDKIHNVISKLEMRINNEKEIKYLLDIMVWKRDQQISKIINNSRRD